jgi:hypothetical protein
MMTYEIKMITNKKWTKAHKRMKILKKMNSPKRRRDRERQISCTESIQTE